VLITSSGQQLGSTAIFGFLGAATVRYGDIEAPLLIYAVPIAALSALGGARHRYRRQGCKEHA
jgi:hypothetical protein